MIPTVVEIAQSLYGAWRLARLDKGAMVFFDTSEGGFWRSFFAAVLIAPFYGLMLMARYTAVAQDADPLRFALAESIAYVMSWVAFPLAVEAITRMTNRRDRFCGYIVAYNWAMVIENAVLIPIAVAMAFGWLPLDAGQFLWITLIMLILIYLGFIARTALAITGLAAAGFVFLDVALSIVISGWAESLY